MKVHDCDIDVSKIIVHPPKRIDDVFTCKLTYNDSSDKLILALEGCICLHDNNRSCTMTIKPKNVKKVSKLMVQIEDSILARTKMNAGSWFYDKIKMDSFDSNFHSCVIIHANPYTEALKIKYIGESTDMDSNNMYDMRLQIHSIRFKKNAFNLIWKFVSVKPSVHTKDDDCMVIHEEYDCENVDQCDNIEDLVEVSELYEYTKDKVAQNIKRIECILSIEGEKLIEFKDLAKVLSSDQPVNIQDLMKIADRIETLV